VIKTTREITHDAHFYRASTGDNNLLWSHIKQLSSTAKIMGKTAVNNAECMDSCAESMVHLTGDLRKGVSAYCLLP
jgi:hypothetical protein